MSKRTIRVVDLVFGLLAFSLGAVFGRATETPVWFLILSVAVGALASEGLTALLRRGES